ncbi:hypothetical protein SDC9_125145 [bioreactor metagenome]|uniref:Uncharacterized protein n=1 Tax=bioreactor metagenome TaxID=1076179 RepID=A0A645CML9_9ZZZZ
MATSTITEPFFMVFTISSVTVFGALAPVTRTAPINKSAFFITLAKLYSLNIKVVILLPNISLR